MPAALWISAFAEIWSLALPAQDNLASKEIGEDIEKQHIGSRAKT